MAYNNKFIHFKTKETFMSQDGVNNDPENATSGSEDTHDAVYGQIKGNSIVFIKDSKEIYTHGNLYKSVNWSVLKPEVALAGDIAYWDGSKVKTVSQENWDASLGTPVGVVVVPEGFAPDGKARMLSLNWASKTGTGSTSASTMVWSISYTDTSLTNHTKVPTTDNAGSITTGSSNYGYLPSDKFTGSNKSYVDPLANYSGDTPYIPSPYLGDNPNPAYYAEISGYNNALADFDGKANTDTLVALGSDYVAANAAKNYKAAGAEEIEWYLPAAGEFGYIMPRFNKIQAALTKVNASQLNDSDYYWSSTEYLSDAAYYMYVRNSCVSDCSKMYCYYRVRPFAIID